MRTRIENITPKKAQALLDKHWIPERQRKPSQSVVDSYARAMRTGQWVLTHQGIGIDDNGELVDGLHRLLAIVQSGATIPMMITTGILHNGHTEGIYVIDAIDRGRVRGVGQQLQLRHNIKNGNLYAAVCRSVLWLCTYSERLLPGRFDVSHALRIIDIYGKEIDYCVDNRSSDFRIKNAAPIGTAAFALKAYKNQIKEFYQGLTTGEELKTGNPALTCRRWFFKTQQKAGSLSEYRAVLTCAMKYVNQEKLRKLYDTERGYNFFLEKQRQAVARVLETCGYK